VRRDSSVVLETRQPVMGTNFRGDSAPVQTGAGTHSTSYTMVEPCLFRG